MKKISFITFLLASAAAYAVECQDPLVCVKKASEMCTGDTPKFFGKDECVECDCPDGGKKTELIVDGHTYTTCCKDGWHIKANGKYKEVFPKMCGCPNGGKKTKYTDDLGITSITCCKDGYEYDEDDVGNYIGYTGTDRIECCLEERKYPATEMKEVYWHDEDYKFKSGFYPQPIEGKYLCCYGSVFEYETEILNKGSQKIKQCCKNDYTSCSSDKDGVTISIDGECRCGCLNNSDCNKGWTKASGKVRRICNDDRTCVLPESFSIEGIRVEIEDFNGGKLNKDAITRLVQKVRSEMLATTGNAEVRIVFSGRNGNLTMDGKSGFYGVDGGKTIYVNSGFCTPADDYINCEAIIIHENIHRVDDLNKSQFGAGQSELELIYKQLLSEIHAHAEDNRYHITELLKKCYTIDNGEATSVCKNDLTSDFFSCFTCRFPPYHMRNYITAEYAEKYFTNPGWFEANNCNGLRGKLEQTFLDDVLRRTSYYKYYMDHIKGLRTKYTEKKYFLDKAKVAAQLGRTRWVSKRDEGSLAEMLAELYNSAADKNGLCMSPQKFAMNPGWNFDLSNSDFIEFKELHDFFKTNGACMENMASKACADFMKTMDCLDSGWRTDCVPDSDLQSDWFYNPMTFTFVGGY